MDRCALFVDAGYLLADGARAVHGTRTRESVSWDYPGLLRLLTDLARERTGLPVLRCYWYEATVEGRRTAEHETIADLPGLKLRLARIRPGRREGVDAQVHRDLMTLARNGAICDAVVVSGDEDLTQVVCDAQDLGIRVTVVHLAASGEGAASRALRQECDDLIELSSTHLRPFVSLAAGAVSLPAGENAAALPPAQQPSANGHSRTGAQALGTGQLNTGQLNTGQVNTGQPSGMPAASLPQAATAAQSPSAARPAPGAALPAYPGPGYDSPSPLPAPASSAAPQQPAGAATGAHGGAHAGTPGGGHTGSHAATGATGSHAAPSGTGHLGAHAAGPTPAGQTGGAQLGGQYGTQTGGQPSGQTGGQLGGQPTGQGPAPSAVPVGQSPTTPTPATGSQPLAGYGAYTGPQPAPVPAAQQGGSSATTNLAEAVKAAHQEGHDFGESVARDAPALWLEAVLARKPRMPSDLEARLLQGSSLPIDFLLHDEVRHALRRGFWDALERARR